jgi:hypothetical protein
MVHGVILMNLKDIQTLFNLSPTDDFGWEVAADYLDAQGEHRLAMAFRLGFDDLSSVVVTWPDPYDPGNGTGRGWGNSYGQGHGDGTGRSNDVGNGNGSGSGEVIQVGLRPTYRPNCYFAYGCQSGTRDFLELWSDP